MVLLETGLKYCSHLQHLLANVKCAMFRNDMYQVGGKNPERSTHNFEDTSLECPV